MSDFAHLALIACLIGFANVDSSQCCSLESAVLVQRKWQEAMASMDTTAKVQLLDDIVTSLTKRWPAVDDVIRGHLAIDPDYRHIERKHAYLKFLQDVGVMVALITNENGLERQTKHFVVTNHVHYGEELDALVSVMEAIFWGVYQISYLNPALWYSCVFGIMHKIEFQAAKAITERVYARCDISPLSGDESEPIQGLIVFEQSIYGGSTVVRGRLSGFDTTDSDQSHGFHIHTVGSLGNKCLDAGSHYNPQNATHGAPYHDTRHIGDLGNIEETPEGLADIYIWDRKLSLSGEHSVINRSVVVHESSDSFRNPSTYGGRLGCCVITMINPLDMI